MKDLTNIYNLDKAQHMAGCFLLTFASYSLLSLFGPFSLHVNKIISFFISALISIGKETYDYYHSDKHTCDGLDLVADFVGTLSFLSLI